MTLAAARTGGMAALAAAIIALAVFAAVSLSADRPPLDGSTLSKVESGQEYITMKSRSTEHTERAANAMHARGYRLLQSEINEWSGTTVLHFRRGSAPSPGDSQ